MYGKWCALTYHVNEPLLNQHNKKYKLKSTKSTSVAQMLNVRMVSFYSLGPITKDLEEQRKHEFLIVPSRSHLRNMPMVDEQIIKIEVGSVN